MTVNPNAIVIPATGPVTTITLRADPGESNLAHLQELVGGYIEALPIPAFIKGADDATAYINEDGKFDPECKPNMRATDFMVPGVGIMPRDYIAGTMVLVGFNWRIGTHATDLPPAVVQRVNLIIHESGTESA